MRILSSRPRLPTPSCRLQQALPRLKARIYRYLFSRIASRILYRHRLLLKLGTMLLVSAPARWCQPAVASPATQVPRPPTLVTHNPRCPSLRTTQCCCSSVSQALCQTFTCSCSISTKVAPRWEYERVISVNLRCKKKQMQDGKTSISIG